MTHDSQSNGPCSEAVLTLENRVITVVADTLGREPDEIEAGQSLITQLGANSIDLVDLGFRLEQEFGIELDTNRLIDPVTTPPSPPGRADLTVGRVVELVRQAQAGDRPDGAARRLEYP